MDAQAKLGLPPVEEQSPEQLRAGLAQTVAQLPPVVESGLAVSDRKIQSPVDDIPLRIYQPSGKGPFPSVVYFHGGGWVTGTLDSHDRFCRALATQSEAVVVAVDYRLAPEHRFPAAPEDCFAATEWTIAHAAEWKSDARRVLVAGDSAGGNLATVVALMRRDQGSAPALAGQILLWPATGPYDPPTKSYLENSGGYGLTRKGMIHFWNLYLNDPAEMTNPYAAPLNSSDLTGLPSALVITAEHDVLRDEGDRYAQRLAAAHVPVMHECVAGVNHGFAVWADADPSLAQAQETRGKIAAWIKEGPN
ncbi:MAG: alpha/beta hydrolase [Acidobacteriota bacterium]|nr:alpha/beta hydrolase [Acidobacteriota bacterium]